MRVSMKISSGYEIKLKNDIPRICCPPTPLTMLSDAGFITWLNLRLISYLPHVIYHPCVQRARHFTNLACFAGCSCLGLLSGSDMPTM